MRQQHNEVNTTVYRILLPVPGRSFSRPVSFREESGVTEQRTAAREKVSTVEPWFRSSKGRQI